MSEERSTSAPSDHERQVSAARESAPPPGYLSAAYAHAQAGDGVPRHLPRSGAWLLERQVPGAAGLRDARGGYPLLTARDWAGLPDDLDELAGLVSVVAVVDPFAAADPALLRACFRDHLTPYKGHYVVDLRVPATTRTSARHRRNVTRAARTLEVAVCHSPGRWADDWVRLYDHLRDRRAVTGPADFSAGALRAHLEVPGALVLRAEAGGAVVGMSIWYAHGCNAYYHLAAYDDDGYRLRASFALFDRAFAVLRDAGVERVGLGGAPGAVDSAENGLASFKRGWATEMLTVQIGGRVLDPVRYAALAAGRTSPSGFFPVYRTAGEG